MIRYSLDEVISWRMAPAYKPDYLQKLFKRRSKVGILDILVAEYIPCEHALRAALHAMTEKQREAFASECLKSSVELVGFKVVKNGPISSKCRIKLLESVVSALREKRDLWADGYYAASGYVDAYRYAKIANAAMVSAAEDVRQALILLALAGEIG